MTRNINHIKRAQALLNPGIRSMIADCEGDADEFFKVSQVIITQVCETYPYQETEDITDKAIEWGARLVATIIVVIIIVVIAGLFV